MNIWDNIKLTFKQGSGTIKLIYVNVGVFILLKTCIIVLQLFKIDASFIIHWLAVPASLTSLAERFWTPITYMFMHRDLTHLFFNMLCLFWFGRIFLSLFSQRHLIGLYLIGGLMGASFYIAAFNLFPYYEDKILGGLMLGASGSVTAIIVASAMKLPNMEIRLFFVGNIKLKFIAIATILISFLGITDVNGGGQLAHLGGALAGYLFVALQNKGVDITNIINKPIDWLVTLFRPRKMKVKKTKQKPASKMNDGEYNQAKNDNMAEIDRILDKIKQSGYNSLSENEKKSLFEQGKK